MKEALGVAAVMAQARSKRTVVFQSWLPKAMQNGIAFETQRMQAPSCRMRLSEVRPVCETRV